MYGEPDRQLCMLCYVLCLFYACRPKISNCLSQHHIVTLASCRLLCHSNIRSCSLMCLIALSQHHAALALSLALPCLSMLHAALQCSALSRLLDHVDRSACTHMEQSCPINELEFNGCEILDCPMNYRVRVLRKDVRIHTSTYIDKTLFDQHGARSGSPQ